MGPGSLNLPLPLPFHFFIFVYISFTTTSLLISCLLPSSSINHKQWGRVTKHEPLLSSPKRR
ncbi:hypothetical protein IC582_025633 [Cucumis melo]